MMRLFSQSLVAVLSLSLITQTIGCGSIPTGEDATRPDPTQKTLATVVFPGDEVFQGIYLGGGPVAGIMPTLWEKLDMAGARGSLKAATKDDLAAEVETQLTAAGVSDESATRMAARATGPAKSDAASDAKVDSRETGRAAVIAAVKAADPTFFGRFGDDMQSGDHVRVAAALEEGTKRFVQALAAVSGGSANTFVQTDQLESGTVNVNINVNVNVVAVAVAIVAVAVLVIVIFAKPAKPGGLSGLEPDAQLQRDIAVDYFATQLGN